jgi:ornithine cyclodeaminase
VKAGRLAYLEARHVNQVLHQIGPLAGADLMGQAYCRHADGDLVNPASLFVRLGGDREPDRVIALPALRNGPDPVFGLKWIASVPGNLSSGLPRASALILINDRATGRPIAIMDGAAISLARTAWSALAAARVLHPSRRIHRLGVIGAGPLARQTALAILADGFDADHVLIHDLDPNRSAALATDLAAVPALGPRTDAPVFRAASRDELADCSLVILATSAVTPHLDVPRPWVDARATLLHLSLRDIHPASMRQFRHAVDSVALATSPGTSLGDAVRLDPELPVTEIAALLSGQVIADRSAPWCFSPYGMGILDLVLAMEVLHRAGPVVRFLDGLLESPLNQPI